MQTKGHMNFKSVGYNQVQVVWFPLFFIIYMFLIVPSAQNRREVEDFQYYQNSSRWFKKCFFMNQSGTNFLFQWHREKITSTKWQKKKKSQQQEKHVRAEARPQEMKGARQRRGGSITGSVDVCCSGPNMSLPSSTPLKQGGIWGCSAFWEQCIYMRTVPHTNIKLTCFSASCQASCSHWAKSNRKLSPYTSLVQKGKRPPAEGSTEQGTLPATAAGMCDENVGHLCSFSPCSGHVSSWHVLIYQHFFFRFYEERSGNKEQREINQKFYSVLFKS